MFKISYDISASGKVAFTVRQAQTYVDCHVTCRYVIMTQKKKYFRLIHLHFTNNCINNLHLHKESIVYAFVDRKGLKKNGNQLRLTKALFATLA